MVGIAQKSGGPSFLEGSSRFYELFKNPLENRVGGLLRETIISSEPHSPYRDKRGTRIDKGEAQHRGVHGRTGVRGGRGPIPRLNRAPGIILHRAAHEGFQEESKGETNNQWNKENSQVQDLFNPRKTKITSSLDIQDSEFLVPMLTKRNQILRNFSQCPTF